MKITKSRLRQIIQEELQSIQEQKLNEGTIEDAAARRKDLQYAAKKKGIKLTAVSAMTQPERRELVNSIPYRELPSYVAPQKLTHDPADLDRPLYDVPSDEEGEEEESVACGEDTYNPAYETCIGGTVYTTDSAEAVAAAEQSGKPAKATGGRRRRRGGALTGRRVNAMHRAGKFGEYMGNPTKVKNKKGDAYQTWLKLRRALGRKDQAGAIQMLADAGLGPDGEPMIVEPETPTPSITDMYAAEADREEKERLQAAGGGEAAGSWEDPIGLEGETVTAAAPEATRAQRIAALRGEMENLQRHDPQNPGLKRRFDDLVSKGLEGLGGEDVAGAEGYEIAQARASKHFRKLLRNKINQIKLEPKIAGVRAKQGQRAAQARGRELSTVTGGLPAMGGMPRESLNRLTKIVEEEFDKVLNKKRSLNEVSDPVLTATTPMGKQLEKAGLAAVGYKGLDRAGQAVLAAQARRPDLAKKILDTSMEYAGKNMSSSDLVDALKGVKAKAAQVAKKVPEKVPEKSKTKVTTVSGTPPEHQMKTVEKGGYIIATATTEDGIVGTGKAKIRGAAGRNSAGSAAKMRAKVALMRAVSKSSRRAAGGGGAQQGSGRR
jgi:hypothetical protein